MKSISAPLLAHVSGQCTTLATLWLAIRTDGHVFAFTDLDGDITYDGHTYLAATGITPSSLASGSDLAVDTSEMVGILNSATITDTDILAGLWDYAEVLVRQVNYMDLSQSHIWLRRGTLGEIKTGRDQFTAELRGLTQNLQQSVARIYQTSCGARLGDARCKVDMTSRTYLGSVSSVASQRSFGTDLALAAGLCNNGVVSWLTGANAGRKMEVKYFGGSGASLGDTYSGTTSSGTPSVIDLPLTTGQTLTAVYRVIDNTGLEYSKATSSPSVGQYFQVGNQLQFHHDDQNKAMTVKYGYSTFVGGVSGQVDLQQAMFGLISPGDTFSITEGCDKTVGMCKAIFSNVDNFQGFPFIRSPDAILAGPK